MKELKMVRRRAKTILVVCALLFLVQQARVAHCTHHHHHNTTDATGTKRGDLVGVAVTAAASAVSTYLVNWLGKKRAAVINVVNLSNDYFIADGCDADISTHIGTPPGDLNPNDGMTDIEVEIESKWGQAKSTLRNIKKNFANTIYQFLTPVKEGLEPVVEELVDAAPETAAPGTKSQKPMTKDEKTTWKAKLKKLFNIKPNEKVNDDKNDDARAAMFDEDDAPEDQKDVKKEYPNYFKQNLGVRCSFSKPAEGDHAGGKRKARVVFYMTLRGGKNTNDKIPTAMAVTLCVDGSTTELDKNADKTTVAETAVPKCEKYNKYDLMKEPIEEWTTAVEFNYLWEESDKPNEKLFLGNEQRPLSQYIAESPMWWSMAAGMFEKKAKKNAADTSEVPIKPIYWCNKVVGNCISAMMGNGGATITEIAIHNFYDDFGPPKKSPPPQN